MKAVKTLLARLPGRPNDTGLYVSRRKLLAASISGAFLAACGSPAPAANTPAPAGQPTAAPAVASGGDRLDKILKAGTLRVGTFLQYKPYTFKNEKGEADGWDTDVAKALVEDMGVKADFVDNSWDGIIPALQADKFDAIIAAMTPTKKRGLVINFTKPYAMAYSAFIIRQGDESKYSSLEKFNDPNITVSVLIQDASHVTMSRFFPQAKIQDFNSAEEAILAVQTNKVDASIAEYSFLGAYAKEHPGLVVKAVDYPGSSQPLAGGLTAGPDNEHFYKFLNLWIDHFFWSGQFEPIFKKWFPDAPLPKPDRFVSPI